MLCNTQFSIYKGRQSNKCSIKVVLFFYLIFYCFSATKSFVSSFHKIQNFLKKN